jgi:arginine/lysine/ornithine decarboxylase
MMLRSLFLCLLILSATSANAQTAKIAAFNKVAEASLEQFRMFLNCSATDPETYAQVQTSWDELIADTVKVLERTNVPANVIATFKASAAPAAVMLTERPFGEVIRYCGRDQDWAKKFLAQDFIMLPTEAARIFGGQ